MKQLKQIFKTSEHVFFCGSYDTPADPLLASDKEYIHATAHDIWKVSGYCFRWEKDHVTTENNDNICE